MDNLDAYGGYQGGGGLNNMYAFIQNNQIWDMEGQFYENELNLINTWSMERICTWNCFSIRSTLSSWAKKPPQVNAEVTGNAYKNYFLKTGDDVYLCSSAVIRFGVLLKTERHRLHNS